MNSTRDISGSVHANAAGYCRLCVRLVSVLLLAVILGNPLLAGLALWTQADAGCAMACCKRDKGHCSRAKSRGHEAALHAKSGCGSKCPQPGVIQSAQFLAAAVCAAVVGIVPSLVLPVIEAESSSHYTDWQTTRLPRPPPSA